jgi:hypothetical protein
MGAKNPLTKLFVAYLVLAILAERKGNHASRSAFFARQQWTRQEACQFVRGSCRFGLVYRVLVSLWFPWNTQNRTIRLSRVSRGPSAVPRSSKWEDRRMIPEELQLKPLFKPWHWNQVSQCRNLR